jgi:hypothetical protein
MVVEETLSSPLLIIDFLHTLTNRLSQQPRLPPRSTLLCLDLSPAVMEEICFVKSTKTRSIPAMRRECHPLIQILFQERKKVASREPPFLRVTIPQAQEGTCTSLPMMQEYFLSSRAVFELVRQQRSLAPEARLLRSSWQQDQAETLFKTPMHFCPTLPFARRTRASLMAVFPSPSRHDTLSRSTAHPCLRNHSSSRLRD